MVISLCSKGSFGLRSSCIEVFDYTSYFVTVGLSNTVQLRLLLSYSVMLELLESLLCCLTWHFFFSSSFLPGCNKDVLFNLRVSSRTDPGLYKHASDFWKL